MLIQSLLVAHIAVLGYWLGSELVINSTYRYVAYAADMPFDARGRLMDHVMDVDQHVRYALVLQFGLGFALAALYGYLPGRTDMAIGVGATAAAWLLFVEAVHRLRHRPIGAHLAALDRGSRYLILAALLAVAFGLLGSDWAMPFWLRLKLGLFAGVMACGVGIRLALISHFRIWTRATIAGLDDQINADLRATYWRATAVLILLWIFIAGIVVASVWKPA